MHQRHAEPALALAGLADADHQCGVFVGVARLVPGGDEAAQAAAAVHMNAQRLDRSHGNVHPVAAGRRENTE